MIALSAWQGLGRLLAEAAALGAEFRICGDCVAMDRLDALPADLADGLRANAGLAFEFLDGTRPDREAQRFFDKLQVRAELVTTPDGVAAAFEALDRDANGGSGSIAIDVETAPVPEHALARPPIKINRDGALSAVQPAPKDRTALDPHRAYVAVLQLYAGGSVAYVMHGADTIAAVLNSAWLRTKNLVSHNAGFEVAFLQHWSARHPIAAVHSASRGQVHCTLQATGLLIGVGFGGVGRGLDRSAEHFVGKRPPKALQLSDWSAPSLSRGQIAYAASDVVLGHRLWAILQADLHRTGRWDVYELQRRAIPSVADMERRGLQLDQVEHVRQVDAWTAELADARRRYTAATGNPPPATPNQIREWMRQIFPPDLLAQWPRTPKGDSLSTESAHLKRLVHLPGAVPVLRLLRLEKLISTFGPKLNHHINPVTGRIHPSFQIAAAKSGRFSCARPNLQQLPSRRAPEFRKCIIAAPGNVLVGCDWNQVELRAAAWISGDPALNTIYDRGLDLHSEMAALISGVPVEQVTREQRQAAKAITFGSLYGIGPSALSQSAFDGYDVELSEQEARTALDRFFQRFAVLDQWRRRHADRCMADGVIHIGAGRVVEAAWEPGDRLTFPQCCNLPIQGICADAMLRAITLVHARLQRHRICGGLIATIHDELLLEVEAQDAEPAQEILHGAMVDAFELTFPGAPATNLAAAHIGATWAALK